MMKIAAFFIFAVFVPASGPSIKAIDIQCEAVNGVKMCMIPAAQIKALIEHNNAAAKEVDRLRKVCNAGNQI